MVSARIRLLLQSVLAACAAISVAGAWSAGVLHHVFDYDEIEHAHTIWLVAHGLRPFLDFFEVHPPFMWWSLVPLARLLPRTIDFLLGLRFFAAAGSAVALLMLGANIRVVRRDLPLPWIVAGLLLPAAFAWNVAYFAEFRIDSWPLALILAGAAVASNVRRSTARAAFAGFAVVSGVLLSPKLVFLGAAFLGLDVLLSARRGVSAALRLTIAYVVGTAGAVAIAVAALLARGIPPSTAYDLVIRFHAAFARVAKFKESLGHALLDEPLLLTMIVAGFFCWLIASIRRRITPAPFEMAAVVFLLLEIAFVPLPYKQYTVPCFVVGSLFIPSIYYALEPFGEVIREAVLLLLLAWTIHLGLSSASFWRLWRGIETERQYLAYLEAAGVPGQRVLVPMAAHPVNAFDASYYVNRSDDPAGKNDSETVMARLGIPASRHFTSAAYREELERNRPFLIIDRDLSPVHTAAVRRYLLEHAAEYEKRTAFGREMWFRKTAR